MTDYKFSDNYVGFSESKLHLLRDRFEYASIPFEQINEIILKNGKSINNWRVIFVIGIIFLIFGIFTSKNIFEYFFSDGPGMIQIELIVASICVTLIGIFFMIRSLKQEIILEVTIGNKTKRFAMDNFRKENQLDDLVNFLSIKTKFRREI